MNSGFMISRINPIVLTLSALVSDPGIYLGTGGPQDPQLYFSFFGLFNAL